MAENDDIARPPWASDVVKRKVPSTAAAAAPPPPVVREDPGKPAQIPLWKQQKLVRVW
jgi:hypothetical protein